MLYSVGDVVSSYYYWFNPTNNKKEGIIRPVIIKEIIGSNYVVIKISRSNKKEGLIRIQVKSKEWREMGLYDQSKDSFVDRTAVQLISEREIERKIGECPLVIFELLF